MVKTKCSRCEKDLFRTGGFENGEEVLYVIPCNCGFANIYRENAEFVHTVLGDNKISDKLRRDAEAIERAK